MIRRRFIAALLGACLLWLTDDVRAFDCAPESFGTGSRIVTKATPTGTWRYMWCPSPTAGVYADGKPKAWRLQTHACLTKYCTLSAGAVTGALWNIATASDKVAAMNAAALESTIVPTDPHELYAYKVLRREACLDAYTPPYIVDIIPLPGPHCGDAPLPPAPPVDVWRAPAAGNTLYTTINGKLATRIVGRTAAPGALCNCATPIAVGASTYCPLATGVPSEVTLCKKVAP
jgi:hypothetical protein